MICRTPSASTWALGFSHTTALRPRRRSKLATKIIAVATVCFVISVVFASFPTVSHAQCGNVAVKLEDYVSRSNKLDDSSCGSGPGNDNKPDLYMELLVFGTGVSCDSYQFWRGATDEVTSGNSHAQEDYVVFFCDMNGSSLWARVWETDGENHPRDLMAGHDEDLQINPTGFYYVYGGSSDVFNVLAYRNPSPPPAFDCAGRAMPLNPPPGSIHPIMVTLPITSVGSPDVVTVTETVPPGFVYLGGPPPVPVVTPLTVDGEDAGTALTWNLLNPAPGTEMLLAYDVQVPINPAQMSQPFRLSVDQDGFSYSFGMPVEQLSVTGFVNDCNGNLVDDGIDIATGTLADCDGNAIPDICDPDYVLLDCQPNGIDDRCELADGSVADANGDLIPDDCPGGLSAAQALPGDESARVRAIPNPARHSAEISFTLEIASRVRVDVFDATGALVATLSNGPRTAGQHQVLWDGRTRAGSAAPSGVYFIRVRGPQVTEESKLVVLE